MTIPLEPDRTIQRASLLTRLTTRQHLPILTTSIVCLLLYVGACFYFNGFFSMSVTARFFQNNAYMGMLAVGMTFVILSGGIDLSVGAAVGCGSILIAAMAQPEQTTLAPVQFLGTHLGTGGAMVLVVAGMTLFGGLMGALIHFFELPPFLVTLGGMFFYRGVALITHDGQISLTRDATVDKLTVSWGVHIGNTRFMVDTPMVMFFAVILVSVAVFLLTSFGRNVYAIGGNETSAKLMGLPVARTKIATYAISGFCCGLGAIAYVIASTAGDATAASGMELDAIAAVVVGGTLLTGGVGQVGGTLLGVAIYGVIGSILRFNGTKAPGSAQMMVGVLLLVFIVLQKVLQPRGARGH